jgi:hypothetical protein
MNDYQPQTLEQVKYFIEGSQKVEIRGLNAREKYHWIEEGLKRFRYPKLLKEGKGLIKIYLLKGHRLFTSSVNQIGWYLSAYRPC